MITQRIILTGKATIYISIVLTILFSVFWAAPLKPLIYHGDREELVFLNHTGKAYFVMNKESMDSMAGNLNQAMSQMKNALKNAPPEQRAMMERMMKGRLGAMQTPHIEEPVLKKTGFEKVNGYKCIKYETYKGDEMVRLHYVTR